MADFTYVTKDLDMLDELCWRHYGHSSAVPTVLEANPGLADLGPVFGAGITILLPEIAAPVTDQPIRLWD